MRTPFVESAPGPAVLNRRLVSDDETMPARREAMVDRVMAGLMARRLNGWGAVSWCDAAKPNYLRISE
ncbi:hypothetical protein [Streptomyces longisporoflavus]|uniref:hypothetical protein n=1 Tax=Streptomyces longisporoflavus TaxID=28044 RepID=UPI00167DAABA|nr:hypothetical protein [Streptomyces longisporoflavus]